MIRSHVFFPGHAYFAQHDDYLEPQSPLPLPNLAFGFTDCTRPNDTIHPKLFGLPAVGLAPLLAERF